MVAHMQSARHVLFCSFCRTERNADCSCKIALKAFTVAIADTTRSARVAACRKWVPLALRRGVAIRCKMIWRITMAGTTESITRVRAHDWKNPRAKQVMQVVIC